MFRPASTIIRVVVAVSFLAVLPCSTDAQGVLDAEAARSVLRCQKAITAAERTFTGATFAGLKKCLDTVFACVQVKPGDADCQARASLTCDTQFLRIDQAAIKLRATIAKSCGATVLPYDTLRTAEALRLDALSSSCALVGSADLESLGSYTECLRRIVECHVSDLVLAGAPRAEDLFGSIGQDLRRPFCPTPTPAPTATVSPIPTPTRTTTPVVSPTLTAIATETRTATPTPIATPTSVTPTPTPSETSTPPPPTTTPAATATPSATVTPTATATPALFNFVFVTSTLHNGNLGGLVGADAICAARASAAGLTGVYAAWLSTSSVDAVTRLGGTRGFIRADGEPFTDQPSGLAQNELWNTLHVDETGADVGADVVWTGTAKNGTKTAETCGDWTTTSGTGRTGRTRGGPASWTDPGFLPNCSIPHRIYCFGIDGVGTALSPTVTAGKIAFITNGTLALASAPGIAGADALCASEAAGSSLAGAYKALLATTTSTAISRFTPAASYVRPDGTLIADGATLAAGGTLASGIWQRPTGVYLASFSDIAWTGAETPSSLGTVASTCNNFTSSAGTGFFGRATLADPTWWRESGTAACTQSRHVYCLQE